MIPKNNVYKNYMKKIIKKLITLIIISNKRQLWTVPVNNGNERHTDDKKIEKIEGRSTKSAVMYKSPIRNHLQANFNCEDSGKEVIKIIENLISRWSWFQRILGSQHRWRNHNADQNHITKITVIANPMTKYSKSEN